MAVEDFTTIRKCPRCLYDIHPGYYHKEQPQPEGGSHVVCSLKRTNATMRGPLVEVLSAYLDKEQKKITDTNPL